ncbi:MAG TPA: glutamate formimidoyltransferase [Bacteroidota bacterium]|nr:glutamate formimidoyltransferase [Bacteroidota bacterium]
MKQLVECVPNFSEGRDRGVIDAIAESIRKIKGVKLLSMEPDKDYHRSVVTFVGEPEGVKDAAFAATAVASERIDMTRHKGEHPRLGATDVVPFIPVSGVTMKDCVRLANEFGKRVAEELQIPVYLYEEAARVADRKNLSVIRKGEYEGLQEKLKDPSWKPDYGEAKFNAHSGALVTGARFFLIAYNVNLATNNKDLAHEIALRIRESGRTVKDAVGRSTKIPGTLKAVKAMGVMLERFNIAQVSINLTNYTVTPPHVAYEEVRKEAEKLGTRATGSEVVGLIPKEAMLMAGKFYSHASPQSESEDQLISRAIEFLGLSHLEPFNPNEKIIENLI